MNNFKGYIITGIVAVVVALGLGFLLPHSATAPSSFGGTTENYPVWFYNGLSAGTLSTTGVSGSKFVVSTSGGLTVNGIINTGTFTSPFAQSSSSPAVLGSASVGHFVLPTGGTTVFASTTAVTLNSDIQLQQELTSPIPGTTCNTGIASGTAVTDLAGLGANSGFKVNTQTAPITNPFCYSFSISN